MNEVRTAPAWPGSFNTIIAVRSVVCAQSVKRNAGSSGGSGASQAVQRPDVRSPYLPGGHGGGRQRHVDADRPGGDHGVGGVADQQEAVPGPVTYQRDHRGQWEERSEVPQPAGERGEQRSQPAQARGDGRDSHLAPAAPGVHRQQETGLDLARIFRQQEERHFPERKVEGLRPVRRRIDDEPDHVERVLTVLM
jgi:hypothetical protein